jgi:L-lactate dehydrogenase complex protein LldG
MNPRAANDEPLNARRPDDSTRATDDQTRARTEILSRIRTATADADAVEIPRDYRQRGADAGSSALLDRFAERVADYRAEVHRCRGDMVARTIAEILADRSRRRIVVPGGFPAAWVAPRPADTIPREEIDAPHAIEAGGAIEVIEVIDGQTVTVAELDGSDGTVSLCAVAIAETGTVVLDAGPGQGPRALSLVPDYLLVVVRAEQIVDLVGEALARLDPLRPLTWISGPSATSDIELNRVEGVHGPRTLDVLIVESG